MMYFGKDDKERWPTGLPVRVVMKSAYSSQHSTYGKILLKGIRDQQGVAVIIADALS